MNRRSLVAAMVLTLLAGAAPRVASAQVVRGEVVGDGGERVAGVVVLLVDSVGVTVRRALTGAAGTFTIAAPRPGTFSVQTMRLGFRPARAPLGLLVAGRDTSLRITVSRVPATLGRVEVSAQRTCGHTGSDAAAAGVWNAVRTALEAQSLTEASGNYRMRTVLAERPLDGRGRELPPASQQFREGPSVQPFASLSADSLARIGYVSDATGPVDWDAVTQRGRIGDITFRGPDATVILSDRFVRDHCFQLVASPDPDQQEVGLEFSPSGPHPDRVEIRGTMWVDRRTSQLRRIVFAYEGLPAELGNASGGSVEYLALPGGGWIIRRWTIRMPRPGLVPAGAPNGRFGGAPPAWRISRVGTQAASGEVLDVWRGRDIAWTARDRHLFLAHPGAERDGATVPRVRVGLLDRTAGAGTLRLLHADAKGRYEVDSLLPSATMLAVVWNLDADPLAIAPDSQPVLPRRAADTSVVTLRVPGMRDVTSRLCGSRLRDPGARAIVGVVRSASGVAVPGTSLQATFTPGPGEGDRTPGTARAERRTARADAEGRFLICDVPAETPIVLVPAASNAQGTPLTVVIPGTRGYENVEVRVP